MIITTEGRLKQFLQDFNHKKFSFDVETTALRQDKLSLIGVSLYDGSNKCYIPIDDTGEHNVLHSNIVIKHIKSLFVQDNVHIAHNFVFDARVLCKYNIDMYQCNPRDTLIAHHLINENDKHGLKHLTRTILGRDVEEYDDASANVYSERFYEYAIADAVNTFDLWKEFEVQIEELGLKKLYYGIEMPFQMVLLEMSLNGMLVDAQKRLKFQRTVQDDINHYLIEMSRQIGLKCEIQYNLMGDYEVVPPINFNSGVQVGDILFNHYGLEPIETTPTGAPSVGKATKEHYKEHEFVKTYNEYTGAVKLLSSFIDPMPNFIQEDGRIRTELLDFGAKTGRLSSRNMNLQQLPKPKEGGYDKVNFRELYVASPGYKMIAVDYSQQELRVLAQISNCKNMIDAFLSGHDFHSFTANQMGVDRRQAKIINFGVAYRKGAYGFAKDWDTTEDEAQKFLDKYFDKHPEVLAAMKKCDKEVWDKGYVRSIAGRYRRFEKINGEYYSKRDLRQAFNFLVQGASADITRIGCIKVQRYARANPEYDVRLLITIHDELVVECKEEYAEQVRTDLEKVFASAVTSNFVVPLVAEASIGDNYAEVK